MATECAFIPAEDIDKTFRLTSIDLISSKLAGSVTATSDQWFAEASNLINPKPPISGNGKVVYTGGWYDGWETRRHNKLDFDYVIVKLGSELTRNGGGFVYGAEIDTAFFNGNEAPAISIEGFRAERAPILNEENKALDDDIVSWGHGEGKWEVILSKQPCGPTRRQAWLLKTPTKRSYTHVRLCMYPDGGIARFRLYGRPSPPQLEGSKGVVLDLAAATNAGRCVDCSDEHFSTANNLLLPGRGIDMGDGWETRRSRAPGHVDWVITRLGVPGNLERVVVDTAHFRGNFPDNCQVYGINWEGKKGDPRSDDPNWVDLSGLQDCEAHKEHVFECKGKMLGAATHVKLVIIPDGGVKRLRAFGTPVFVTD